MNPLLCQSGSIHVQSSRERDMKERERIDSRLSTNFDGTNMSDWLIMEERNATHEHQTGQVCPRFDRPRRSSMPLLEGSVPIILLAKIFLQICEIG